MAERELRRLLEADAEAAPLLERRDRTVDEAVDALRDRLATQGASKSYRGNCESMQRGHISPALGGAG